MNRDHRDLHVLTPPFPTRRSADLLAAHRSGNEFDDGRPCPFCPGNEEATPPALETYGPGGSWLVRVVPNLYPAFEGNEPMRVQNLGPVFTDRKSTRLNSSH